MPTFRIPRKMETRRLGNSDLKRLARFSRGVPSSYYSRDDSYHKAVKRKIKSLPRSLQQRMFSISGQRPLCSTHKGLNHHLMNELWSWIRHELSSGIGKFIFPLIVSGVLTADQEDRIRQLEPVLQIYRKDFKLELSAPPGRDCIDRGAKWAYETNQCSACILGRIGSDERVLFALYAGMIGRFSMIKLLRKKVPLPELTVAKLDHPKSKRVCFVRYWIKATGKNESLLYEATELGIKLKKLHRKWQDTQRTERVSVYDGRYSLGGTTAHDSVKGSTARTSLVKDPFRDPERSPTVPGRDFVNDRSRASRDSRRSSQDSQRPRTLINAGNSTHKAIRPDSGRHPALRPHNTNRYTHGTSSRHINSDPFEPPIHSSRPLPKSSVSDAPSAFTLRPEDSISMVASARIAPPRVVKRPSKSHDPIITNYPPPRFSPPESSTPTIQSYDGGGGPALSYASNPFETEKERLQQYKELLRGPNPFAGEASIHARGLPRPRQQSMYSHYGRGEEDEDPFGDVDEEIVHGEGEVEGEYGEEDGYGDGESEWEQAEAV